MEKDNNLMFEQHYQPIIKLVRNEISHYEVLSRAKNNKSGKNIFDLIQEYEEKGEIYDFDMKNVEIISKKLDDHNFGEGHAFAVNLSADTIQDKRFISGLKEIYHNMSGDKSRLIFEITETKPIYNHSVVNEFINVVKLNKGKVSLDDFGTGFADERTVSLINIDTLKIDGEFVDNILSDQLSRKFIEKAVQIASFKGIKTIAERVENREQMEELKSLGVDMIQGYFVAKPTAEPAPQKAIDYVLNKEFDKDFENNSTGLSF
ncbi:EAL domain-containing protein [Psychromonas sp. SP041]|uniref:EAL domain-containing protein n=1 Tax=Psychromonas sp. SP041 TaxID=1365007 RepID=UPI00148577B1|nr:EAL domain-containing protein [Psychromonas sp. SP041]